MMRKISVSLIVTALILGTIISCNKKSNDDAPEEGADRKALLTHAADNIIVPSFEAFKTSLDNLKTAINNFTATPDENKLSELRTQWQNAYLAWQSVELFHFGPADDVSLRNHFNIYPTDATLINSYVASGSYNLETFTNNKVQGFPALDYLINGLAANDADITAFYTGTDASKWKKYLTDIITIMDSKLNTVVNAWKGSYRNEFVENTGTGAGSSLSKLINEYIMYFERFLRSGKYAIPAGAMTGTVALKK